MRITVGGVLLTAGVGTWLALGHLNVFDGSLTTRVSDLMDRGKSMLGFPVPSPSIEKTMEPVTPPKSKPVAASAAGDGLSAASLSASTETVAAKSNETVPEIAKTPAPAPAIAASARPAAALAGSTSLRSYQKRRPRFPRRIVPPAPPPSASVTHVVPPAARAAKKVATDPAVGTYVTVKLKSGSEVKGIFQGRTAQGIRIELPGTGPFDYPSGKVVGITAAQ